MSKVIAIFSDGTGQAGGARPDQRLSNVYKLYRASRSGPDSKISPFEQICFYDPGLGSAEIGGPFWKQPLEYIRKLLSSATGSGFSRNVVDCYEAMLRHYEPGDIIYLFGFSRGAYTVRTVGGVMNLCGIPTQDGEGNPLPNHGPALREIAEEAVREVYEHGAGFPRAKYEDEREEKARRFRVRYACEDTKEENLRGNVCPYFIGVFDTVAALGTDGMKRLGILLLALLAGFGVAWATTFVLTWLLPVSFWIVGALAGLVVCLVGARGYWKSHHKKIENWPKEGESRSHFARWKFRHYDMFLDPRVRYGRHAQAIDETRASFARVGWGQVADAKKGPDDWLIQLWFAGNHSDIGGSYPETESRLSDIALTWMVYEATMNEHPLALDWPKLNLYPDAAGMQHCEVLGLQQGYPSWVPKCFQFTWKEKVRPNISLVSCHDSFFERVRMKSISKMGIAQPYRPQALADSQEFQELVTGLENQSP